MCQIHSNACHLYANWSLLLALDISCLFFIYPVCLQISCLLELLILACIFLYPDHIMPPSFPGVVFVVLMQMATKSVFS